MADSLKPCICGSSVQIDEEHVNGRIVYRIMCKNLKHKAHVEVALSDKQEAIDVWNNRPLEDTANERARKLRDFLSRAMSVVQMFCRENPAWVDPDEDLQDPCGAHELVTEVAEFDREVSGE